MRVDRPASAGKTRVSNRTQPDSNDGIAPPPSRTAELSRILAAPDANRLGRRARSPVQIPWPGWKAVLRRTFNSMTSDRVSLAAAGCAFYATLALFPTITMLVSLYGLAFDPVTVEPQLQVLRNLLPPAAFTLISGRVHDLVSQHGGTLSIGFAVSLAVALWSVMAGTKSMLAALNLAYDETERRGFLHYQVTALTMTLCAILGAIIGLVILVGVPVVVGFLGFTAHQQGLIRLAGFSTLLIFVAVALSLLYRFGPCRRAARWRWITPGSVLATFLWLAASALFSWYVAHVASYNVTYGPLGAVVGVLMWFYVTAYIVLLGAELNSELELQTVRDSTDGPPKPIGRRGAYVADHVADQ